MDVGVGAQPREADPGVGQAVYTVFGLPGVPVSDAQHRLPGLAVGGAGGARSAVIAALPFAFVTHRRFFANVRRAQAGAWDAQ